MPEQSSDPWRILWQFSTSDAVLVVLLVATAASVVLTSWIPQQPTSDADYARWLSQVQARFSGAVSVLRVLGVFNITSSFGFRLLLALVSSCLLLRLVEKVDRLRRSQEVSESSGDWTKVPGRQLRTLVDDLRRRRYRVVGGRSVFQIDRWPWARLFPLVAHGGALLLLAGLLISRLWGWQVDGLVLQNGQRASLPGVGNWVAVTENGGGLIHSPGVVAFFEREGPGVHVRAVGEQDELLQIQLAAEAEPSGEVMIALTEDGYFAIPEAALIARLTPRSAEAYTRVDVQVYRSPPGEIITETVTEEGGQARLAVAGVTMEFTPAPYALVTATCNPGRWAAGLGLVLLMIGVLGNVTWPAHRFWLRQDDASIAAAGPVPSWLLEEDA
jgi:cytochrome c biogenesis protein ResB